MNNTQTLGMKLITALSGPYIDARYMERCFLIKYASNMFQKMIFLRLHFFYLIMRIYSGVFRLSFFSFKKDACFVSECILRNINVVSVFGLFIKEDMTINTIQQSRNPSFNFEKIHSRFMPIVDPSLIVNKQNLMTASSSTPYNYYHFMTDYILPFLTVENNSHKELYLPFCPSGWQIDILSEFSIKFCHANFQANTFFSTIEVIPSIFIKLSSYKDSTEYIFNSTVVSKLRTEVLKTNLPKKFKIFCSRRGYSREPKFINLIEDMFRSRGFTIYNSSDTQFKQAMEFFSNAEIIVGIHGAALTNLIFAPDGCKIIELVPHNSKDNRENGFVFKRLAEASNLYYNRIRYEDSIDYWSKTIMNLELLE